MHRRVARLRKEYLYRKSLEGKERLLFEKKRKIKEALAEGKPVPTELKNEFDQLQKEVQLDDDETKELKTHIDDEYARSGVDDPRILITTAREATSRLMQFAKEMKLCIPNSKRINRGGTVLKELVDMCRTNDFTDLVIFHEHRGEPDGMIISHMPYGPTAYFGLYNVVLRHDIAQGVDTMSEAYPHMIFHNFSTQLGERVTNILKHIFPVPKDESRRVITFANQDDFISFRNHSYKKTGHKQVELQELGPRFEMRLYQIKLGTIDMTEAELEWVLRPYMNTAKKKKRM